MSEHTGIPSFIQNVNYLAQNTHLLQLSGGLLTPETVKALKVATGLPFSEIIKDISKGVTPEGRRKIDIGFAEVQDQGSDYAHYTSITITGSLDNFSYTHEVGSVGVHELYDVQEAIKDAIDAYNVAASAEGLYPIENYVVEVHYPENPCKRPVIRIRDDDPEADHAFLSSITLHTESDIDLTTNWNDTTSALLSLGANQSQIYSVMAATEGFASDAGISAQAAIASASAANTSAEDSLNSADHAEVSNQSALAAATTAETSMLESASQAEAAAASATAAETSASASEASAVRAEAAATSTEASEDHIVETIDTVRSEVALARADASEANINAASALQKADNAEFTANGIAGAANQALVFASDALALIEEITDDTPLGPISWHEQETLRNTAIPANMNAASYGPVLVIGDTFATTIGENSVWSIL